MAKIVILNGPPNAGKDVIASHLVKDIGANHLEFKESLFTLCKMLYTISDSRFKELYSRELKETPMDELGGISIRDAMINVSENVVKPNFGEDFFGRYASSVVDKDATVNVFSDGGFLSEVVPMTEAYGASNILVLRIHREGCTFDGDSRNYLPNKTRSYQAIDFYNNDTLNEAFEKAANLVGDFI